MRNEGLRVIDVLAEFKASGRSDRELYFDDVHATPLGSELVARAVRREVEAALADLRTRR